MRSIHLIMPMGGAGTRFFNEGYAVPKPLILINDKPFFYWATQSIVNFIKVKSLTFVVLQSHIDSFAIDDEIKQYYPYARVVILPEVLNGAVLTCMRGVTEVQADEGIIFNDCDHLFKCSAFNDFCEQENINSIDGAILTFDSQEPKYSYLCLDDQGNICGTVEKQVVSNKAICGAYYFKNKEVFLKNAQDYLKSCSYSEYFISGVYNSMIFNHLNIQNFEVDFHLPFGTPDEYEKAINSKMFDEVQ